MPTEYNNEEDVGDCHRIVFIRFACGTEIRYE